ncbi:hypothetical protein VPH35_065513 [Triticum aestivum]
MPDPFLTPSPTQSSSGVPTPCGSEISHTSCATATLWSCRPAVARRRHHRTASRRPPPRSPLYLMESQLPPPRRRSWTLVFEIERTSCKAAKPRGQEELDTHGECRPRGFWPRGAPSARIHP